MFLEFLKILVPFPKILAISQENYGHSPKYFAPPLYMGIGSRFLGLARGGGSSAYIRWLSNSGVAKRGLQPSPYNAKNRKE